MKDTDTKKYKDAIIKHGFIEYELTVTVKVRCGGEFPGWAADAVRDTIQETLPKKGIMIDSVYIGWPLKEVPRG